MDGFHGNHHFSHFRKKDGGHWRGDHFENGTFYNLYYLFLLMSNCIYGQMQEKHGATRSFGGPRS